MFRKILSSARVLAAWLAAAALALVILIVGLDPYMLVWRVTLQTSHWADTFLRDVYFAIGGLVWLGFFMFEDYLFNKAQEKGRLLQVFLRVFGIEWATIFLLQLLRSAYYPGTLFSAASLVMLACGLLGAGMLYFGWRKPQV